MTPRVLGLLVAAVGLALDQASKLYVLRVADLGETGPVAIAPFAEFRLVWNYGISYGLLRQEGDLGRWLLVVLSLAASVLIVVWLGRTERRLEALSLGLILGGAVGNAIDRSAYGAVVDFVHLFLPDRSLSWYVFNLADVWIVAGVAGLLYEMAFSGPTGATKSGSS
ncbi:signal peptidase II [Prosthecomicrobium sp. N25]|uniref:signal peptidase II n=1 Tax=Prosthecomicrobium sp. N25 TaxID=3129254 RepID=UPI0030787172